jgi:GNAT superfamily N-acetyltransferase
MTVIIKLVQNKCDLKKFVKFPFGLYRNNPCWVPPLQREILGTLNKNENPAFESCDAEYWLAYQDGKIVGRIAGIINYRHNEYTGKKQTRFGWVDFVDDPNVSEKLLKTVEQWAKDNGAESLYGPLGFNDLDQSGMLVEGFEELSTMATIYNYSYYPQHLEKHGYQKEVDWVEYKIWTPLEIPPQIDDYANRIARQQGVHVVETHSRKDILQYAREIFVLFQETYKALYGFVPLSEKQVDDVVQKYFSFIHHEYVALVVDKNDKLVAFGITMPSLSKALQKTRGRLLPFGWWHLKRAMKYCDVVDFYLIGVKPELQGKGIPALILNKIGHTFLEKGIKYAESNPELEMNTKVQAQWKFFERRQHKRRRCYVKALNSNN